MVSKDDDALDQFMQGLIKRNPHEKEFHQAVFEVASTIIPFLQDKPHYRELQILERLTEPDRIISFRVCWEDDQGNIRVNRGYRVQHNNAIGPYKGGIRFHSELSLSVLKFLAFEQTFKNSLTGLPMGGGKGGTNFNPKGKSDREIMRFCQSFMTELQRHIGPHTDVPAGDIGVGAREISYLFGQYKRICNEFTGVLTGKGLEFGGSRIRTEATGYGAVYMMMNMMKCHNLEVEDRTALISGAGNVAQFAAEKLIELGVKVITLSDSTGFIHDPDGIDTEKLEHIKYIKNHLRGSLDQYVKRFKKASYYAGKRPWGIPGEIAIPCATQNEIDIDDAKALIKNGCICVIEGANMPTRHDAYPLFKEAKVLFSPSKAANAGGVAISGLEMTQNSMRLSWNRSEVDFMLQEIMSDIHDKCVEHGQHNKIVDYVKGANIAGFVKVADAMLAYGVI